MQKAHNFPSDSEHTLQKAAACGLRHGCLPPLLSEAQEPVVSAKRRKNWGHRMCKSPYMDSRLCGPPVSCEIPPHPSDSLSPCRTTQPRKVCRSKGSTRARLPSIEIGDLSPHPSSIAWRHAHLLQQPNVK